MLIGPYNIHVCELVRINWPRMFVSTGRSCESIKDISSGVLSSNGSLDVSKYTVLIFT